MAAMRRLSSLRRARPCSLRRNLPDAALQHFPAIDIVEKALDESCGLRLFLGLKTRNRCKHPEELSSAGRDLGGEYASLSLVRAIAAVGALAKSVDVDTFLYTCVGSIDE